MLMESQSLYGSQYSPLHEGEYFVLFFFSERLSTLFSKFVLEAMTSS